MAVVVGLLGSGVTIAAETGRHQRVGEVDIYYGILPAQVAGKHEPTHEERTMHGGVPGGRDKHHLIVALINKDGSRIVDAQVTATVTELGMAGTSKPLEPMRIDDTTSFGNYFAFPGAGPYRITLEIRMPGARQPVEAVFEYRAH
ncbi:hypothetical protein GPA25_19635 [Aromatoleum diolicum]|uniref:YtkA-like domain-containing protein n=1 Tax=Aromatoleum diolicum TaxID=75796 RepID=A0ABX1QF80_9RHOO|nr:hypothetical protein [Aromatoleum diolicum]